MNPPPLTWTKATFPVPIRPPGQSKIVPFPVARRIDCHVSASFVCSADPSELFFLMMKRSIISCSPDVMGGTPVFAGTRVPVQTVLEYLEAGETIDDFLEGFPTVTRDQVIGLLEEAKELLVAKAP